MTTTDRLPITQEERPEDGSTAAGDLRSETPAAPALDDVMRHLRNARRRVAEVEARCAAQVASLREEVEEDCKKAQAAAERITKADRERIADLEALAAAHLAAERARNPRIKHLDSLWGRISSREAQPTICWPTDEDVLLGWASALGHVRTTVKRSIDKAALKRVCRVEGARLIHPTGGEVPYVVVEFGGRSVTVDTLP